MNQALTNWIEILCGNGGIENYEAAKKVLVVCQIGIYLFFSLAFLSVFINKHKKNIGFFLFFLYFFSYAILSIVVFIHGMDKLSFPLFLSALNSFFLVLSFRYFNIVQSLKWRIFGFWNWVFISIAPCIVLVLYSLGNQNDKTPDVILSVIIFCILSCILFFQFRRRENIFLGVISLFVCGLIIFSQLYLLNDENPTSITKTVFNAISLVGTSALGTIFLSLAVSWEYEELGREKFNKEIDEIRNDNSKINNALLLATERQSDYKKKSDENKEQVEKIETELKRKNERTTSLEKLNSINEAKIIELESQIAKLSLIINEGKEQKLIPDNVTIQIFSRSELPQKGDIVKVKFRFGSKDVIVDITNIGKYKAGLVVFAEQYPNGIEIEALRNRLNEPWGLTGDQETISKWMFETQKKITEEMQKLEDNTLKGKKISIFKKITKGAYSLSVPTKLENVNS